MEAYGPLEAGIDINADDFQLLPKHCAILPIEDLPDFDKFEHW